MDWKKSFSGLETVTFSADTSQILKINNENAGVWSVEFLFKNKDFANDHKNKFGFNFPKRIFNTNKGYELKRARQFFNPEQSDYKNFNLDVSYDFSSESPSLNSTLPRNLDFDDPKIVPALGPLPQELIFKTTYNLIKAGEDLKNHHKELSGSLKNPLSQLNDFLISQQRYLLENIVSGENHASYNSRTGWELDKKSH